MFEIIAFYLFAFLTIAMFSITVFTKNALYALSSLAAGMIFISAFFFLLEADFLGVVQIIVYTGAVMALYAFGMMFFDSINDVTERIANPKVVFGLTGMIALLIVVIFAAPIIGENVQAYYPVHPTYGNAQDVGLVLFTKYLIPFEVAAVMLLVAMIGGIILAGKKMDVSFTEMDEQEIDNHKSDYEITKDVK
ncbi:MAG: NADH-quinone oxidoreductase subunit J [Campylobacteraceae bacterium]|jgi:NADH-quinone oxidoreductase subunit J|nr:NADH-quinone oxidoreductase subunit J [Campylobacteraceae bacterium]MBT3881888.1 NADH-quinone oxidoreductase subunit J [Campylobacteraceae bacterium]MBT4029891.1 NADH-quinone oxidoreductase subunit J [Campylobacteraceae bacterium]MBT4178957.1 NADH-quinone oxidoreductase subunit J [Campylobacteraceae bacterium]MBT4573044.1 NADH-quinone oxidoreductase subunit J [Campylobacteraceae bacterium]